MGLNYKAVINEKQLADMRTRGVLAFSGLPKDKAIGGFMAIKNNTYDMLTANGRSVWFAIRRNSEEWHRSVARIRKTADLSWRKTRKGIKELEEKHLLIRQPLFDNKRCFMGAQYILFNEPVILADSGIDASAMPPISAEDDKAKPFVPLRKPEKKVFGAENNRSENQRKRDERYAEEYKRYRELIKDNIEFDLYTENNRNDSERCNLINLIVNYMSEFLSNTRVLIKNNGVYVPKNVSESVILKLNNDHICHVIDKFLLRPNEVNNPKSYLLTMLYNSYNDLTASNINAGAMAEYHMRFGDKPP
jgi:hypothetical protein